MIDLKLLKREKGNGWGYKVGQKEEKRGLLKGVNSRVKKKTKRKRRIQKVRICKRYRGRGKYLILFRPTPLIPVYAHHLTQPAK